MASTSDNPHCAKPVEASAAGRSWHQKDGTTPICDRCRASYNLWDRRREMRKRQEQLRAEREYEEVREHFRELSEHSKRNKARGQFLQALDTIIQLAPKVATWGDIDDDLERVRRELDWAWETIRDTIAVFDRAHDVDKIQRRIGKLRALEQSANPNEAAVAQAMREREEQKLA